MDKGELENRLLELDEIIASSKANTKKMWVPKTEHEKLIGKMNYLVCTHSLTKLKC